MATYHVSNKLWADSDATGTATGGGADYILLKAATSQIDDAFNTWGIYLTGGTGSGQSRRIVDYDQTGNVNGERYAQVESNWGTNPDATTTYEIIEGSDSNNGLGPDNYDGADGAWRQLSYAADQYAADDTVYVKGGRDYTLQDGANNCVMYITTAGTAGTPVIIEGFTTSVGDGGTATINAGTNALVSGIITAIGGNVFHVFKNLRITGGSGDGVDLNGETDDGTFWTNCRFDNNTGYGVQGDNAHVFYLCTADNNTAGGIDVDTQLTAVACQFYTNTGHALWGNGNCTVGFCLFYNNGANRNLRHNSGTFERASIIFNNTFDGDNTAGSVGMYSDSTEAWAMLCLNNIFFDLGDGITCDGNIGKAQIEDYNLFYSNTTNRTNIDTGGNSVAGTGDPFTDSGARDYTLAAGSEALAAGIDAGEL